MRNATEADKNRKAIDIDRWLTRHNIRIMDLTEAEADRVALAYHVAMAKDEAAAWAEECSRAYDRWMRKVAEAGPHNLAQTERCPNEWHRTGPKRAEILCPECPPAS